ncbi:MAG TPA: ATP synthase F0 subunit B [Acidobacteriaceae bacterium]|nr:ATP synthase F0 subunit B [Acidobacteriaceae bacterium]
MRQMRRFGFLILLLALVGGIAVHAGQRHVHAQTVGEGSTPEGQSAASSRQEQHEEDAYLKSPSVVAIGRAVGLNPDQAATAFTVFNFVVLALAFGVVLGKVLPKAIRNRNTAIQKYLVDARTATEEARVRLSSVEERLAKLDGEIAAMRTHAEQEAEKEEQRLRAAVEEEKKKILASAEQEIAAASLQARKQLQQHAAELAIEQAARKLVVTAETDRLLVQRFAQRLTGDNGKKGEN